MVRYKAQTAIQNLSSVNSGVVSQKIRGARSCNFPTNTANFGQNSEESCTFSTEKIAGAQHLTFPLKISPKWRFSAPNFAFLDEHVATKRSFTIFRQLKIESSQLLLSPFALLLRNYCQWIESNRIKSKFFRIELNRICYQLNSPPLIGTHSHIHIASVCYSTHL